MPVVQHREGSYRQTQHLYSAKHQQQKEESQRRMRLTKHKNWLTVQYSTKAMETSLDASNQAEAEGRGEAQGTFYQGISTVVHEWSASQTSKRGVSADSRIKNKLYLE